MEKKRVIALSPVVSQSFVLAWSLTARRAATAKPDCPIPIINTNGPWSSKITFTWHSLTYATNLRLRAIRSNLIWAPLLVKEWTSSIRYPVWLKGTGTSLATPVQLLAVSSSSGMFTKTNTGAGLNPVGTKIWVLCKTYVCYLCFPQTGLQHVANVFDFD